MPNHGRRQWPLDLVRFNWRHRCKTATKKIRARGGTLLLKRMSLTPRGAITARRRSTTPCSHSTIFRSREDVYSATGQRKSGDSHRARTHHVSGCFISNMTYWTSALERYNLVIEGLTVHVLNWCTGSVCSRLRELGRCGHITPSPPAHVPGGPFFRKIYGGPLSAI